MNYYKKNSALDTIKRRKISIILQDPNNNECFECSKLNPECISINNAIFLCKNCIKNHLNLPKSISFIINNNIDNLSMKNIQYLSYGGNKNLKEFIMNNYPNLFNLSFEYLYQTYALDYYRKSIEYLIEGGIKPIKPDNYMGYEIIKLKNEEKNNIEQYIDINKKNNKNQKIIKKIKSDSFIKFRNNPYPKIKPIIGTNSESRLTYFSNPKRINNKLSQTTTNLFYKDNSLDDNNYNHYKTHFQLNSTSFENKRTFYPSFKSNYDIDDDINHNLSNIKATIYEYNNNTIQKKNINLREKILKRNELKKDFKILNSNPTTRNNSNNNIYARYMSQNYLNNYQNNNNQRNLYRNDNSYNINGDNKTTIFNYSRRKINNLELKSYLQNKDRDNEKYIFNLKLNSAKPTLINKLNEEEIKEIKKNANINNINNNIIINRNLNVFYNNNSYNKNNNSQKIFKKKTIGNSFSHLEKRNSLNNYNYNYSLEKLDYFLPLKNNEQNFNNQRNINKKIIQRNENKNSFIKVNKIKTISKRNQIPNITNEYINDNKSAQNIKITVKRNFNNNDNFYSNNYNNNLEKEENQESKIIQRISRVFKTQKERQKKLKTLEGKEKINETSDSNKEFNNFKFKIINVKKIKNKRKEKSKDIINTDKTSEKNNVNNVKEIKIKIYKRNDKISNTNNIIESRKANHSLMRELNNLPSGKKKSIIEIIKTNILSNKSVSPDFQRILKIPDKE